MINFALEDFSQCKQCDVLLLHARIYDYVTAARFQLVEYMIFLEYKDPKTANLLRVPPVGEQRAYIVPHKIVPHYSYYRTTPDEWPDEIATVRMKLILEGRLKV